MVLPQWHGFIDPVLRVMVDGVVRRNVEIRAAVANRAQLTEQEMAETLPSGEARWANRINWLFAFRGEYQPAEMNSCHLPGGTS